MTSRPIRQTTLQLALTGGLIAPVLYFAIQLIAAPFYPGYNFLTNIASDLGATTFRYGGVFNIGVLTVGGLLMLGSAGIGLALRRMGTHPLLIAFALITVLGSSVAAIWAGLNPLPSPAHGGPPALSMLMLLVPLALTAALWQLPHARLWLMLGIVLILALVPVMSGALQIDTRPYTGLLQRVLALAVFGTIGGASWFLRRQVAAV